IPGFEAHYASAASLADVQLFENVDITATLTEKDVDPHELALNMTSTSLVNLELVGPQRVALFDVSELAGKLQKNGTASVQVEILPITMDDVPALSSALQGVQGAINGLVNTLLDDILQHPLVTSNPLVSVEVEGLSELQTAVANLTNLDNILTTILKDYTDSVDYTINPDGTIVVEYTDGLGNHLEGLIQEAVAQAVSDVNNAVNALEIKASGLIGGLLGPIIEGVTNDLLLPLVGEVTNVLSTLTDQIANGTINLTNDLASAQILGETNISLNVLVDNPVGLEGDVLVKGASITTTVI